MREKKLRPSKISELRSEVLLTLPGSRSLGNYSEFLNEFYRRSKFHVQINSKDSY